VKPIEELSEREARRVNRVVASPILSDAKRQSWDVELYSLADGPPIASNACTLDAEGVLDHIDGYTSVMLGRIGLERIEPWSAGDVPGALTARVAAVARNAAQ
jgi:hypothetical protein